MYGRNSAADFRRAAKAILTNQLARTAPNFYVRLTAQTGRGREPETDQEVADYFRRCFGEYFEQLGVDTADISKWLHGKHLLEYGPGDVPGVALLMLAYGAESVDCVDRFAMSRLSPMQVKVLQRLLDALDSEARARANACFETLGDPGSGFRKDRLRYLVTQNGLSGLQGSVDLAYSRAVLEHVNELQATFEDMFLALKPGGVTVHQVDLRSHGLHYENPLDFLTWPVWLWDMMYSGKGMPNRWRIDAYRDAMGTFGFEVQVLEPVLVTSIDNVQAVRPYLPEPFGNVDDEDLRWLAFWLVARKPAIGVEAETSCTEPASRSA